MRMWGVGMQMWGVGMGMWGGIDANVGSGDGKVGMGRWGWGVGRDWWGWECGEVLNLYLYIILCNVLCSVGAVHGNVYTPASTL